MQCCKRRYHPWHVLIVWDFLSAFLLFSTPVFAGNRVDESFKPEVNSGVYALAQQEDDKVLLAGEFSRVGSEARPGVARLNPDGTLDAGYTPAAGGDAIVTIMGVQSSGAVVLGTPVKMWRLTAAGGVDSTFSPPTFANGFTDSLRVLTNDQLLVGGSFTSPGCGVTRLTANGAPDPTFKSAVASSTSGFVFDRVGSLLPYGLSNLICGVTYRSKGVLFDESMLLLLNNAGESIGSGYLSRSTDPLIFGTIHDMAADAENNVFTVGDHAFGDTRYVIKLRVSNNSGYREPGFSSDFDEVIDAGHRAQRVVLDRFGCLIVSTIAIGTGTSKIVRIFPDGRVDRSFIIDADGYVRTLLAQSDGGLLVGGAFKTIDGVPQPFLARLKPYAAPVDAGFQDFSYTPPALGMYSNAIVADTNQNVVVVGKFSSVDGKSSGGVVRVTSDGAMDPAFSVQKGFATPAVLYELAQAIAVQPNNKLIVGGDFATYQDAPRPLLARLQPDGTLDTTFVPPVKQAFSMLFGTEWESISRVTSILVRPEGQILAGGLILCTNQSKVSFYTVCQFLPNGAVDPDFRNGSGFTSGSISEDVHAMGLGKDGSLYLCGDFVRYEGQPVKGLMRLNSTGVLDQQFNSNIGTAADGPIKTLAVQPDGRILVGGVFTNFNGVARPSIARLLPDGSVDASFDPHKGFSTNSAAVLALTTDSSGRIYVGGNFFEFDGHAAYNLMRLDPDGTVDTTFHAVGTEFLAGSGNVSALALDSEERLLVAGNFLSFNGVECYATCRIHTKAATADLRVQIYGPAGEVTVSGGPGQRFELETSPDLLTWQSLTNGSCGTNRLMVPMGAPLQFFRAKAK